jgi:hypothetical protein
MVNPEADPTVLLRWEPSWGPFTVDARGKPRTPEDSGAHIFRREGPRWTPMETPWSSTDQEVEGSSPSERAA